MKLLITSLLILIFLTFGSNCYPNSRLKAFDFNIQDTSCFPSTNFVNGQRVLRVVDRQARFPTGAKGLQKYLEINRRYPPEQVEWQGTIYVTFVVDTLGRIRDQCLISRRFKGDLSSIEKEALRLIVTMPNWRPAKHQGKNVPMQVTVPVRF